jgi:type II secretory pathway pseudopilin PulG
MRLAKTIKSSTIKLMFKEQRGLASIVIVSVLVVLITLISLGFARIMNRTIGNSANSSFSSAATYAAQSALNDVGAYLKTNPTSIPSGASTQCKGSNSLLGGPLANDADLSGNGTTKYSCVLMDQTPGDIFYQNIPPNKSKVIPMKTAAAPGRMMISWQATDNNTYVNYPGGGQNLLPCCGSLFIQYRLAAPLLRFRQTLKQCSYIRAVAAVTCPGKVTPL